MFTIQYEYLTRAEDLPGVAEACLRAPIIGLDLETVGFDPYRGQPRLVSLNTGPRAPGSADRVVIIDLFQTKTLDPVRQALAETRGIIVGQNLVFDQKWLWHYYRLKLPRLFDTMRASYLIYNGLNLSHDLYALYERELKERPQAPDLGGSDWSGPLSEDQLRYAAEDVTLLPRLREALRPKLLKLGLRRIAEIEMQVVYPEARIELAGVPFDRERWLRRSASDRACERALKIELLNTLPRPAAQMALLPPEMTEPPLLEIEWEGDEADSDDDIVEKLTRHKRGKKGSSKKGSLFNPDSSKQMLASLQALGLTERVRLKDGRETTIPLQSTNELILAQYAKRYPVVKRIFEYRDYATRLKMFGPHYLDYVHPVTNRIHGRLFPFTGAGRYAMREPNLTQQPRLKEFRSCFRAGSGKKLAICDLDQAELRIMAELANDKRMIHAFANGIDIHAQTAADVLGLDLSKLPEAEALAARQTAKSIGFGFLYGLQAPKFVLYAQAKYGVTVSPAEAEKFRDRYFEKFVGVGQWHEHILATVKPTGLSRTLGGRHRYLDPVLEHNAYLNSPDQGTGADGLKASLIILQDRIDRQYAGRAELILPVHDETIIEADDDPEMLRELAKDQKECMEAGLSEFVKRVPVTASGGVGDSWADKA